MIEEKVLYSYYLNSFKCKYYITQSNKTFSDGKDSINSYGIKIDMLSLEDSIKDTAMLQHVGINENDVRAYIKNLYEGHALPCTIKLLATSAI